MKKFASITGALLAVVLVATTTFSATAPAANEIILAPEFQCERLPDTYWRCYIPASPTATPSPSPTATPTASPTATPTASPTPTSTPTASPTPTVAPTATPSPTPTATPPPPAAGDFILLSRAEFMALPTTGAAWNAVLSRSNQSAGSPTVSDQDDPDNITVLAKAMVATRLNDATKRAQVVTALQQVQNSSIDRALALGRELAAYVLAADLIGYRDPAFVSWVSRMRTVSTSGGPSSLIDCHEERPNNWGTHCGASRVIADLYLGDATDLARAITVWRGWLGDRAQYAGFSYGDTSWQCNASQPVGINPDCIKQGTDIGGVLPDDQRRGGSFSTNPGCENYVHEALQGVTLAMGVLTEAGYPAFSWSNQAVVRAYEWLAANSCNASGDDTFAPFITDHFAGTSFAGTGVSSPGKNFGFSDWIWP